MSRLRRLSLIFLALLPSLLVLFLSGYVVVYGIPHWYENAPHKEVSKLIEERDLKLVQGESQLDSDQFLRLLLEAQAKAQAQAQDRESKLIAAGTFVVAAMSALGTFLLGWRNDRRQDRQDQRQAREFELKIQQLQMELEKARRSQISA
jgi:hypothetical protein